MPTYKLIYFNARGRAELTRLLFVVNDIDYEDFRVSRETWSTMKSGAPQRKLPILEIDGVPVVQSMTMARHVARECGMMGKNNWEMTQVDTVLDTLAELTSEVVIWFYEQDQERKEKIGKKISEETSQRILQFFEKMLENNPKSDGYLVGSMLTVADLALFDQMEYPMEVFPITLEKFPGVASHKQKIEKIPKIADWLSKRPKTVF